MTWFKRLAILAILLMAGRCYAAINAATVWEIRTTGAQANGGGFADLDPGTSVDYSQQAAAQLTLTDCNHPAGSTTLTSAAGGFTAAMVGNVLYVSAGTNFTTGWYQITAYTSGNQVTVDRSLGASACVTADGAVKVGGAFLIGGTLDDDFGSSFVAGNTCYIKAGAYTLGETTSWSNGTGVLPIIIEGYNTSRGDDPTGTDRPLLDGSGGSYSFGTGNYNKVKNIRVSSPTAVTFKAGSESIFVNCWGSHGATSSVFLCYSAGLYLLGCEIYNPQGTGVTHQSNNVVIKNCYIHDCATGISINGSYCSITDNILDSCKVGLNLFSQSYHVVSGNTIRGCLTGISAGTSYADMFVNNIIADNYVGASWTTAEPINYWDYNCWYNNDTNSTNVTQGANKVTGDPAFVSVVGEGADGATNGAGTAFTAASNPFASVTTADCLVIVEAGTGATTGVYDISVVVGNGELTLARSAGASKTGIDYKIIKGHDHTLGAGSSCFDTGIQLGTGVGL